MLNLFLGDVKSAHKRIDESIVLLGECCTKAKKNCCNIDITRVIRELAASKGFRARVSLADGDKQSVVELLKDADRSLRGRHNQYERNNLRHLIKMGPWRLDYWVRLTRLESIIRTGLRW